MSEEEEHEIDEREARKVAEILGLVDAPELSAYVEELGQAMAVHAPRRKLDYHFNVVEMDVPNAFALPGGHIYISRGLLVLSNSEAELANVLGHEIGHVAARHAAQRDVRAKTVGIATVLGAVGAIMAGGDGRAIAGVQVLGAGMMSAYGRDQEREADRIAQDMAATAGVDPIGMSEFLRSLDKTIRLEQGFSRETGFFDTHPSTPERVAEATTRAAVLRWKPELQLAPTRAEYLAKLEGLAIGKPAAEGVFRDGRFLHPDLRVSLSFPYGWQVDNQRARVIAYAPDGDAVVILELQGPGMDPRAAASQYGADEALQFNRGDAIRIGPLDALRVRGLVPTPSGAFEMELTFIAYQGQIYRLSAGARQGRFSRYRGIFRGFTRSFRSLRPSEEESIDEVRLRIAIVAEGEDLLGLSERTGNEWDLNRTAVINGLTVGEPLVAGTPLKIAVRETYGGRASSLDPGSPPAESLEEGGSVEETDAETNPPAPGVEP
ncbi:MAG: M48 family metalloprotease [Deltaproteobacteria bacterium]|nr:M48 family metalloprotease [Deltaproteobacteria bacterium]